MTRTRVLILGAAGRDFHDFNVVYRDRPQYEVVAFTAQQIPHIAGRRYPAELAGALYPEGIPIFPEEQLEELIRELRVERRGREGDPCKYLLRCPIATWSRRRPSREGS